MEGAIERAQDRVRPLSRATLKNPGKADQASEIIRQIVAEDKKSRQQNREFDRKLDDLEAASDVQTDGRRRPRLQAPRSFQT